MPIYEYRCASCGHQQEFLQKVTDPAPALCPKCQQPTLSKMVTAAGFQLKGSGWYATDFKSKAPAPAKTDAAPADAAKADAPKPDSKPDAAKPAEKAGGNPKSEAAAS
jgi:putative FmdB family regulatory protein